MENMTNLSLNQKKVLALFETNPTVTVAKVISVLHIPRPTAKQTLSRLEQLHFIEQAGSGRGTYYQMRDEDVVLDQFGNETVKVFKSLAGFQKLFKQLELKLKSNDYYYAFAFKNEYAEDDVKTLLFEFHQKLAMKKVDDRAIAHKSQKKLLTKIYSGIKNLQLKFVDLDLPTGVIIIDGVVIQLVWGNNPMAFMILNPTVHHNYKQFFEVMWQSSLSTRSSSN